MGKIRSKLNIFSKSYVIGLDLDDRNLKLILAVKEKGRIKINKFEKFELPIGLTRSGIILDQTNLVEFLKVKLNEFFSDWQRKAVLIIAWPDELTYYHFFMPSSLAKESIVNELRSAIPLDLEKLTYYYNVFSYGQKEYIMAAAVANSVLADWQKMLEKLQVSYIFDLASQAIMRNLKNELGQPPALIIDLCASSANLFAVGHAGLLATNYIKIFEKQTIESSIDQIKQTIDALQQELKNKYNSDLGKIIILGEKNRSDSLSQALALLYKNMEIETGQSSLPNEAGPGFIKAVGLALRTSQSMPTQGFKIIDIDWQKTPENTVKANNYSLAGLISNIRSRRLWVFAGLALILLILFVLVPKFVHPVKTNNNPAPLRQQSIVNTIKPTDKVSTRTERFTMVLTKQKSKLSENLAKARIIKNQIRSATGWNDAMQKSRIAANSFKKTGESLSNVPLEKYASGTPFKVPLSFSWLAYSQNEFNQELKDKILKLYQVKPVEIANYRIIDWQSLDNTFFETMVETEFKPIDNKASTSTITTK